MKNRKLFILFAFGIIFLSMFFSSSGILIISSMILDFDNFSIEELLDIFLSCLKYSFIGAFVVTFLDFLFGKFR